MKTRPGLLAIIISIALVLTLGGTGLATPITLRGSTSEEAVSPDDLSARIDFYYTEEGTKESITYGALTIEVTNLTEAPSVYTISELYFNVSDNVEDISLTESTFGLIEGKKDKEGSVLKTKGYNVGGFGKYFYFTFHMCPLSFASNLKARRAAPPTSNRP